MKLSFQSKLVSISSEMEYYAVEVPAKITRALGTTKAVPISATINGSAPFRGSLYPVGAGRHAMRVKASVRKDAGIQGGDRVRVQITVVDRRKETSQVPRDVEKALRSERLWDVFRAMPPGQVSFALRQIEKAAKPETRAKRILELVGLALARRAKLAERKGL